jgi:hypothetical protein
MASEFLKYRRDTFLGWNLVFPFCRCRAAALISLKKDQLVVQFNLWHCNMENMQILEDAFDRLCGLVIRVLGC